MNEAQALLLEINNSDFKEDLALRSKGILNEFQSRTRGMNPLVSKAIKDISKNIQLTIAQL
jgi:hypothetical protein